MSKPTIESPLLRILISLWEQQAFLSPTAETTNRSCRFRQTSTRARLSKAIFHYKSRGLRLCPRVLDVFSLHDNLQELRCPVVESLGFFDILIMSIDHKHVLGLDLMSTQGAGGVRFKPGIHAIDMKGMSALGQQSQDLLTFESVQTNYTL
jgi:hypothetical protein